VPKTENTAPNLMGMIMVGESELGELAKKKRRETQDKESKGNDGRGRSGMNETQTQLVYFA